MHNRYCFSEDSYNMTSERKYGSLFTTSNGYLGVRGSHEENATIGVQGAYVRGLIDEIPFRQELSIDSEYMRRFYVNEDAAKDAEFQEGIINFADILLFRIAVDGETFYPWEGGIHSWNRTLDFKSNTLKRSVVWENSKGDITEFKYSRFASFANDHFYVINVSVKSINHSKPIQITSGLDMRTKSGGFKMTDIAESSADGDCITCILTTKGKYKHRLDIAVVHSFEAKHSEIDDKFITQSFEYQSVKGQENVFEKKICVTTSRDTDGYTVSDGIAELKNKNFDKLLREHHDKWSEFFARLDITVEGDDAFDRDLRFCNYHNAISIPRNDCVHSLAAKNLTGEGYNDYVWWDCEVFQSPVFIYSGIDCIKNVLKYRYERLDAAREYAKAEGYRGARFPFISSVTGEEKVWKHVRHPYMQIHVVADVAWNVINYYNATDDDEFMRKYGLELLCETAEYWISRVELIDDRYEIRGVTGCDEHHPYVDNDAYTNYLVHYCLSKTRDICGKFGQAYNSKIDDIVQKFYLPKEESGYIPQFDGYFELSQTLESVGGGGKGFQMKNAGGQYHLSQVIKQPDVMMLFAYTYNEFSKREYQINWDYYEQMCEASSSLTYPVHAICSFDNNQLYKGYKYLCTTTRMDIDDIHGCCVDGIHAGCSAGAWYGVVRGLLGVQMKHEFVEINPKILPWWKSVKVNLSWHKIPFVISVDGEGFSIESNGDIQINYNGKIMALQGGIKHKFLFEEVQ